MAVSPTEMFASPACLFFCLPPCLGDTPFRVACSPDFVLLCWAWRIVRPAWTGTSCAGTPSERERKRERGGAGLRLPAWEGGRGAALPSRLGSELLPPRAAWHARSLTRLVVCVWMRALTSWLIQKRNTRHAVLLPVPGGRCWLGSSTAAAARERPPASAPLQQNCHPPPTARFHPTPPWCRAGPALALERDERREQRGSKSPPPPPRPQENCGRTAAECFFVWGGSSGGRGGGVRLDTFALK